MRCVSEAEANSFIADTRDRLPLYDWERGNYQVYLLCSCCVSAFMKIASSIMQQRQVQLRPKLSKCMPGGKARGGNRAAGERQPQHGKHETETVTKTATGRGQAVSLPLCMWQQNWKHCECNELSVAKICMHIYKLFWGWATLASSRGTLLPLPLPLCLSCHICHIWCSFLQLFANANCKHATGTCCVNVNAAHNGGACLCLCECVCAIVRMCVCVRLLNARFAVYVVSDKLPAAQEAARLTRKLLRVLTAIQADMSTPLPRRGRGKSCSWRK